MLILYTLLTKGEDGIDLAINLWYSAALTSAQALAIKFDFMTSFSEVAKTKDYSFVTQKLESNGVLKLDLP